MQCEYCISPKTQVVYESYVCDNPNCIAKEKAGKVGMGISVTKFGRDA